MDVRAPEVVGVLGADGVRVRAVLEGPAELGRVDGELQVEVAVAVVVRVPERVGGGLQSKFGHKSLILGSISS